MEKIAYKIPTFNTLFNKYASLVYSKKVPRIPYKSWRLLNKLVNQTGDHLIHFEQQTDSSNMAVFKVYIDDGFLSNYIVVPHEFANMITCKGENSHDVVDDATVTCTTSSNLITPLNITTDYVTTGYTNNSSNYCTTTTTTTGYIPKVEYDSNGDLVYIDSFGNKTIIRSDKSFTLEQTTKEKNTMNIPSFKFDFGPAGDNIAMSPYGLAIKTPQNTWLAFNHDTNQTIEVTGFTFNFKNMIYKMPVAIDQLMAGDMILHQKLPMFVLEIDKDNSRVTAIDLTASEEKVIIPVANVFGFNYITRVAPLFNFGKMTPSADNPFGNIMPMILMSSIMDDNKSKDDNDLLQVMLMMGMMGNNNPFAAMFAGGGSNAH